MSDDARFVVRARAAAACLALVLLARPGLAQNLGRIDFPTSGSGEAQRHFVEGVLYLHNFEFDDAAEEFQAAERLSPGFAMAYWGEAMSYNHPLWEQVDLEAGRAALARLAPTLEGRLALAPTEREKGFLRAVEALYFAPGDKTARDAAYSEAMRVLSEGNPDDLEVTSLYALSILGLTNGDRDHRNYMRAAGMLEEVFARNPLHPGAAHYLIHSYDDPVHAPLGVRAARVYATIAPAASHAQHMVSHIYVALGWWDDSVKANEQAWAVSNARMERKALGIAQRDFHALYWLHYGYLQQGRYDKARALLPVVIETAGTRAMEQHGHHGNSRLGNYDTLMRVQQIVETSDGLAGLPASRGTFLDRFAEAWVALRDGRTADAEVQLREMAPDGPAETVLKTEIEAMVAAKKGDTATAVSLMRKATALEDAQPIGYGPPDPAKPSHELLAEILLAAGRPQEAVVEFRTSLDRAPRRALSLLGLVRAARQAGDVAAADEAAATLKEVWHAADAAVRSRIEPGR